MKYVFYLHSHITFYVAQQVIEKYKINPRDVAYIVARNYTHKAISNALDLEFYNQYYHGDIDKKTSNQYIEVIDQSIKELTQNNSFILYIPSVAHPLKQILATHPQCVAVHLIEEGISNYFNRPELYEKKTESNAWIKKVIWKIYSKIKRIRVINRSVYDILSINPNGICFGLFQGFAPFLPQKNKVIFGEMYKEVDFPKDYQLQEVCLVLLDAISVEQNKLMSEVDFIYFFTNALEKELQQRAIHNIGIKFHPAQKDSIREGIIQFLTQKQIVFFEIPSEISIEQMLVYGKNLTVIGVFSSLLFYAHTLGHTVVSLAYTEKKPKLISFIQKNFPDSFLAYLSENNL